jgi:hypothetical protein
MKLNAVFITNNYVKVYMGGGVAMIIRNRIGIAWEWNEEGELFQSIMIHTIVEKYNL